MRRDVSIKIFSLPSSFKVSASFCENLFSKYYSISQYKNSVVLVPVKRVN